MDGLSTEQRNRWNDFFYSLGISYEEFARRLGFKSDQTVRNWEDRGPPCGRPAYFVGRLTKLALSYGAQNPGEDARVLARHISTGFPPPPWLNGPPSRPAASQGAKIIDLERVVGQKVIRALDAREDPASMTESLRKFIDSVRALGLAAILICVNMGPTLAEVAEIGRRARFRVYVLFNKIFVAAIIIYLPDAGIHIPEFLLSAKSHPSSIIMVDDTAEFFRALESVA